MRLNTLRRALLAAPLLSTLGPFAFPGLAAPPVRAQERSGANAPTVRTMEAARGNREMVTPSGVRYVDLRLGEGDEAGTGKIVEVHYVGWLQDGTRFDSSRDHNRPLTFRLGAGDVLKGWDEGIVGMKVGGKRRLTIPPGLGFGREGVGSVVPPNSILFYELELLGVR